MFGFLKSKQVKLADNIAKLFHPVFYSIKTLNGGVEPDRAQIAKDDFVIAYMFGTYMMAAKMQGFEDGLVGGVRIHNGLRSLFLDFFHSKSQ